MNVKTTKLCPMQKEKKRTHRYPIINVTITSMAGIVFKEMQGHEWRPHVHRRTDVVQTSRAG